MSITKTSALEMFILSCALIASGCSLKKLWVLTESEIAEMAMPSVVTLKALDEKGQVQQTGSGFVINAEGLVVTNHHVIEGAHAAQVVFASGDSQEVAGITHVDKARDIAFLRIHATNLTAIELGDSDKLSLGEKAIAIGSPLGLEKTVTDGIVSQVRQENGIRVVQHTAAISPGSSGGPLLNSEAKVIGINTFYLSKGQSLFFAMPSNYLKPFSGHLTVTKTLAQYKVEEAEAQAKAAMEELKKSVTLFQHPDGWVQFIMPKDYVSSVDNQVDQDGTRNLTVVAYAPQAERNGMNGWLSDGIRVSLRVAPAEKVWTDTYQTTWGPAKLSGLLSGYDRHFLERKSSLTADGMVGTSIFVKGTAPAISSTEAAYLHVLSSPKCVATIEVTAPVEQIKKVDLLNELVLRSFDTGCQ